MTPTAGWIGLVAGTLAAVLVAFLTEDAFGSLSIGVIPLERPGRRLRGGRPRRSSSTSCSSIGISLVTKPHPPEDLVGLVYSETPKETRQDPLEHTYPWYRRTLPLAGLSLAMVTVLNILF